MKNIRRPSIIFLTATTFIFISFLSPVHLLGKRTFAEPCRIGGQITSLFSHEREEQMCNRDQGLICTLGKCACTPGRVWETQTYLFGITVGTGRGCAGGAGSPCFGANRNTQCVANAHCEFARCRCDKGFRSNGGQCLSQTTGNGGSITFPDVSGIFNNINNNLNNNNNMDGNSNNQEEKGIVKFPS